MKKKGLSYKDLAIAGNLAPTTLADFQNGTIPREATVKRMVIPLGIDPGEIIKILPMLNVRTKKVTITIECGYCKKMGTVTTARPNYVKYPHTKCARAASIKNSKKPRVREMDRIKLITQNDIYIKNTNKKEARKRKCLSCPRTFLSKHFGNRICPHCTGNIERNSLCDRRHTVII